MILNLSDLLYFNAMHRKCISSGAIIRTELIIRLKVDVTVNLFSRRLPIYVY